MEKPYKVFDLKNPESGEYYALHMGYLVKGDAEWNAHDLRSIGCKVEIVENDRGGKFLYDRKQQPRIKFDEREA